MNVIINGAPTVNLLGIQNNASGVPVYEPETVPTHLPHVFAYAERGPTLPQLVSGESLRQNFGAETMNPRGKYYNHATHLINVLQGVGNAVMFQRIIPSDAGPKSRLLLSLDIVSDQVPTYQRNDDGTYQLDGSGNRIPTGSTIAGYKAKWVLNDWTVGVNTTDPFGEVEVQSGSLTSSSNVQSQLYPILELEANFIGAYGNNLGLRLSAPTTESAAPTNASVAERIKAFIYRLQLVQRANATSTANIVNTLNSEPVMEFTLKPGSVHPQTDEELYLGDTFIKKYQRTLRGFPPEYGPFGAIHLYTDNLEEILNNIATIEVQYDTLPVSEVDFTADDIYSVNIFTGVNLNDVPYHSLNLLGTNDGGIRFTDNTTLFAAGGSDGTMSAAAFDAAVRNQLANYGSLEAPLLDDAAYPQSVIYDTGYTLETKKAMLSVLGKRKDIAVIVSTQDVSAPINSPSAEVAMAVALRTHARNFPESELYGTSVCRAMVIGHAGYLLDDSYRGLLPFTIEVAAKFGRYMGASNGRWVSGQAFDMPPNNQITMFRDANIVFKSAQSRSVDWDNGLVWAQRYDRLSYFIPAFQTVFDDDTSTLNSARTMFAAIELQEVAQRVWRDLTGITSLTSDQFIERSNRLIAEKTADRFDNSLIVVPTTFFTPADTQRGYSWSCKMDLYTGNMYTVGTFTVTANRIDDLGGTP